METRDTPGLPPAAPAAAGTVLVVDDLASNVRILERVLVAGGYVVLTASAGDDALRLVREGLPDVVLMDVRMPGRDGCSVCAELKNDPGTRLIPVVLMTGSAERADRVRAIEAGADDFLTKPVDESELTARVRSLIRLKRYTDELDSAESVILSLARTVEARDPCTEGHCERLSRYAVTLGRRLRLPDDDVAALPRGGYLHDLGKIAIPDAILTKPGPLTPAEYDAMKRHAAIGEELCGNLRALTRVRPIVRHHHEKLDGSGYPDGLKGSAIPLLAQVIGVVDVFDALTTWRPYKSAVPAESALLQLDREVRQGWRSRALVDELITAVRDGDIATPPVIRPAVTATGA
jgi:putative two-component system response regulator